jgi:threonine synthase
MDCSFICPSCGAKYSVTKEIWRCKCGNYLDLDYHPLLNRDNLNKADRSFWRYKDVLPLNDFSNAISYGEGTTPLVNMVFNDVKFLGKMDFMLPSGSFKDRGASLMISKCKEMEIDEIASCSSTGMAGRRNKRSKGPWQLWRIARMEQRQIDSGNHHQQKRG